MQESFLSSFKALEPELCITAAYGNILPTKFLKIPSVGESNEFIYVFRSLSTLWILSGLLLWRCYGFLVGTVNIHPSLLPLYRGAAPVQRAIQVDILHS